MADRPRERRTGNGKSRSAKNGERAGQSEARRRRSLSGEADRGWRAWLKLPEITSRQQRWTMAVVLALMAALLTFPVFFETPTDWEVGQVVDRDIKASRTYLVEDTQSTDQRRREAEQAVPPVYDYNDRLAATISARISESFDLARSTLPDQTDAAAVWDPAKTDGVKPEFEAALGLELSPAQWGLLKTEKFRADMEEGLIVLLTSVLGSMVAPSREELLEQRDRGITVRWLSNGKERLVKDLFVLLDVGMAQRRMRVEVHNLPLAGVTNRRAIQRLLGEVAGHLLRPNLTLNVKETTERRRAAAKAVKPVFYQVRRGEMLIREGDRITPPILARLSRETSSRVTEQAWLKLIGMFLMVLVLLRSLYSSGLFDQGRGKLDGRDLVFAGATIIFTFALGRMLMPVLIELARQAPQLDSQSLIGLMPVAVGAMLVSSILGLEAAFLTAIIVSLLIAQLTDSPLSVFTLYLASSIMGARAIRLFRSRFVIIKAGLFAGLVAGVMQLAIRLVQADALVIATPIEMIAGLGGGLLSGVIVAGLIPLTELGFGYTTHAKLLELANLDQPVLKELLLQAPGSYHHSVIVAAMVESAAESIGADPLLAKVAAYYHDVGKIKKPLYFIENQAGGENRHQKLAPSMSALILIAHVKDGVELARQAKLGREIADIIAQHHGTSLITYFYDKAVKAAEAEGGKEKVNIEDFRYPGPRPQTKEAGLVMLADQVEAACKSLADPTPARIQGMVNKLMNRAFKDGQLSDCELTLKDLNAIAKSFYRVLAGIHHQRIAYPDQPQMGDAKRKANGDSAQQRSDRRPANGSGAEQTAAEDSDDLRRLGIS